MARGDLEHQLVQAILSSHTLRETVNDMVRCEVRREVSRVRPPELLTARQVADRLKVCVRTFWRRVGQRPELTAHREGVRWRWPEIEAAFTRGEVSPAAASDRGAP